MKRCILAIVTGLLPVSAGAWETREVGGFRVAAMENEASCSMIAVYEDGTHLYASFDAAKTRATVVFSSDVATSVKQDEKHKLDILMTNSRKVDDGWEDIEFTVRWLEDPRKPAFFSQNLESNFLDDLARYDGISFFIGDNMIEGFKLDGSAAAVKALRECGFAVAGLNPKDPFLK